MVRVTSFDRVVLGGLLRLIVQPGRLAADWLNGKRVSTITPWQAALLGLSLFCLIPIAGGYLNGPPPPPSPDAGANEDQLFRYWGMGFLTTVIPIHYLALSLVTAGRSDSSRYRHLTVTLYQLGGVLLILVPTLIAVQLDPTSAAFYIPVLGAPLHIGMMLRGAYGLSWFGAIWRTALILLIDITGFAIFGSLTMAIFMGMAG